MTEIVASPKCPMKGCENYCQAQKFEGKGFFRTCWICRTKCPNHNTCGGSRGTRSDGKLYPKCAKCNFGENYAPKDRKDPKDRKVSKGPKATKSPKAPEDPSDVIDNGPKTDDDN